MPLPEDRNPLLKIVFIQRVLKYIAPKEIGKPLQLRSVCTAWSETVEEFFGAAHVWQHMLAWASVRHTVNLYMLMAMAACNGSNWIVEALVRAGISPNVGNVIAVAARFGRHSLVKMILDFSLERLEDAHGNPQPRVNINNSAGGFTPLQRAVLQKDMKMFKLLFNYIKKLQQQIKANNNTINGIAGSEPVNVDALTQTNEYIYTNKTALGLAYEVSAKDDDDDDDDDEDENDQQNEDDENNNNNNNGNQKKKFDPRTKKQQIIEMLLELGADPKRVGKAPPPLPQITEKEYLARQSAKATRVKAAPLKCTKCKYGVGRYVYCDSCRAPFCCVCAELQLCASIRLWKRYCVICGKAELEKIELNKKAGRPTYDVW